MPHKLIGARLFNAGLQTTLGLAIIASVAAMSVFPARAQGPIYQEGFNDDGEKATPPRYTTTGKDVYSIERIQTELDPTGALGQLGPVYWAHNFEVPAQFVGVPGPTPARRMVMVWDITIDASTASEDVLKLWESAVKWMVNDKANAKIVVSGGVPAIGVLGDRLTAAGYTLVDDDTTVVEDQIGTQGDLLIHALAGSRGATAKLPVISMLSSDLDDLLLGSIGTPATFEAGQGTIVTPAHPAAGGKTGSFTVATGSFNWQLTGDQLPTNAIVLANFIRPITPTIASLADLDAMIAGTKPSTKTTATVDALDFSDTSAGDWTTDNAVPGGATGIWGIVATGKVTVATAGIYSFALGTDEGGRVQIDINKNGFDAADTIIEDLGPHTHTLKFGDANFAAAGTYDFQVLGYNSGGGGDLEVSVATAAGASKTNLVETPGDWEVLGASGATSPVKLQGTLSVTAYVPMGDVENVSVPLMVLLNGPNDTPPGTLFGGGPITGFEGTGFFAGSGLNKFLTDVAVKTLTLSPVNVAGKTNVKITVALAATFLDFETTDYLDIVAFPNGASGSEVVLAHYSPPDGNSKYFVDITHANAHRLNLAFQDVTYDIPAGATDLVIEFRAATTWWNEIVAFDNVRITSGDIVTPPPAGDLKGLLGYWRMDETSGTTVSDSSGKGNNGAITNNAAGAWVTDSERGQVYRATGTNVINFGTILPAMTTSNDFTWSLWIKSDETGTAAAADNNIVFGNRYNSSGVDFNPREFIKFTPSNFEWHFNAAGQNVNYDDFVTNKWTHHLVVKQGTNLTYYRDGAQSTNGTITGAPTNPQPLYLGGQGTLERWKGLADEVAIFDRALSTAEAKQVYDLGKAGSSLAPPVAPGGATISIARSANDAVITFTGTLEAADAVNGPYAAVAGATSPRTVPLSSATAKFYRSRQ